MANPTMSQSRTPGLSSEEARALEEMRFPLMGNRSLEVTGVLLTPQLSHTLTFRADLPLDVAITRLATALNHKARTQFSLTEDLALATDKVAIQTSTGLDMGTKLYDLEPERKRGHGRCIIAFTPDHDLVLDMIAQKRRLGRENLALTEEVETLRKNKGKTSSKPKYSNAAFVSPPTPSATGNAMSPSAEPSATENTSQLIKALQEQFASFIAQSSAKATSQETRIEKLESEIKTAKQENDDLKGTVGRITSNLRNLNTKHFRLHRRIILDNARNKLFQLCNTTRQPGMTNDQLHAYMRDLVSRYYPSVLEELGDDAFRLIFCGKVREEGNKVAHEATSAELSLAVTSQQQRSTRRALIRIYCYTSGEDPSFIENELMYEE